MGQCLGGGGGGLLSLIARTFWHINFFKLFIFGLFCLSLQAVFVKTAHFVILSRVHKHRAKNSYYHIERSDPMGCKAQAVTKKSTEFKIYLKALKLRFKFMDTSPKARYDKKMVQYDKALACRKGLKGAKRGFAHQNGERLPLFGSSAKGCISKSGTIGVDGSLPPLDEPPDDNAPDLRLQIIST